MARYLLEKQGHLYKFPSERTASIRIYSATQSFYDFGRGCGGDVIRLWSHVRGVDSWTALKQIRECFGLNTPDKAHSRDLIRKQEEARRQQIEAKKQEKKRWRMEVDTLKSECQLYQAILINLLGIQANMIQELQKTIQKLEQQSKCVVSGEKEE